MQHNRGFWGALLALVLLTAPAIATFIDILTGPDSPREEKLARTPSLGAGLERFAVDTRFYIQKRFATKEQMVMLNSVVKTEFFSSSPYTTVAAGKEGFLFLTDNEAVNYIQRAELFSSDDLSSWREGLSNTTARLRALGVRYQVLIAPNKDSLHSDKLPQWLHRHKYPQSRLDQLFTALQGAQVGVTYPLAALQQAVADFPQASPFFKTDTHWNEFGAGVAAAELLRDIGVPVAGEIRPEPYLTQKAGDLARMIGQQYLLVEHGWTLPAEWLGAHCVLQDGTDFVIHQTDPLRFKQVNCSGGQPNGLKALVFMDSFGVGLIPPLSAAFEETVFVWRYKLDEALIEQIQPDFVIHQLVERKLQTLNVAGLFDGP